MLPLTPYSETIRLYAPFKDVNGTWHSIVKYYSLKSGYRQKKPYNVDSPYSRIISTCVGNSGKAADSILVSLMTTRLRDEAKNKARAKFFGKIGDASQLGSTATAEAKATYNTVVLGVAKALRAARFVARGRLGDAGNVLGFHPPTVRRTKIRVVRVKGRKTRKYKTTRKYWKMYDGRTILQSSGNAWLWYSYGVKPLVEDLYNASQVFTREQPSTRVFGRGTSVGSSGTPKDLRTYKCRASVSAYVRVSNPNLWLANQLGLLNPVQMFNEGIMFSFVIDWFSNWSDWISQLTDTFGLEIAKPSTFVCLHSKWDWSLNKFPNIQTTIESTRTLEIPSVKLQFAYERFQWQRGANAISLLVQFLGSKK